MLFNIGYNVLYKV